MTTTIAITGKSGSGKTTITRAFLAVIKEKYPDKSILLFDNDLSLLENLSDEITDREYEQYNEENSADIKDEASDESSTDMSDDNSNDFDM